MVPSLTIPKRSNTPVLQLLELVFPMHEFNICQNIVDSVIAELEKHDPVPRLLKTRVVIGKLRQLVPEYLQFAYENLTKETLAEGSTLVIIQKPVIGKCVACGWQGEMGSSGFGCGKCGSATAEIIAGRELYLESLEIEEDDDE